MKLTDERIVELWNVLAQQDNNYATLIPSFARAIEAELVKEQEPVGVIDYKLLHHYSIEWTDGVPEPGTKLYTTPKPCPKCAELQKSVDRLGEDWAKQHAQIVELESDRDEWKKRAEFSFTQRDKLEAELTDVKEVQFPARLTKVTEALKKRKAELESALRYAIDALEKLACLGNGDTYGNSIGNFIAINALTKIKEKKSV